VLGGDAIETALALIARSDRGDQGQAGDDLHAAENAIAALLRK
jgi:hypothetical protein